MGKNKVGMKHKYVGTAQITREMQIDNFSIEQLQSHLRRNPTDMYAANKLIEKLQQRSQQRSARRNLAGKNKVGMKHKYVGTAQITQQRMIDNFSIEQLQRHCRRNPTDMYAGKKLVEKLEQRSEQQRSQQRSA